MTERPERPKLADWLTAVPGLQRVGSEHHGTCPACGGEDRFRVLDDGAAFCRQCAPDAAGFTTLLSAAGLNGARKVTRLPTAGSADKVTEYEIRDTAGKLIAVHGRRDRLLGKDLWWRLPDGTSGLGGRKVKTLPLYRSERIAGTTAAAVCIVEGEKAADALAAAVPTVLALGTITGASSTPAAEVLQPVIDAMLDAGLPVFLWPDADDQGRRHMQRIAKLLGGDVQMIVSAPPDVKGADAADWARLTDRPPWEKLIANAVAPSEAVAATPAKPPAREWALLVTPKETPLPECFAAALDVLNVKLRFNVRSGNDEVKGLHTTEPTSPDGWSKLNDAGLVDLFALIETSIAVPAWRADPRPWRIGTKSTRLDLVTVVSRKNPVDPFAAWLDALPPAAGDNPADTLLIEMFGEASDPEQHGQLQALAMHLVLGTAVHRAYHPGAKQDVTPVIIADGQGQGKSSLAACLLPPRLPGAVVRGRLVAQHDAEGGRRGHRRQGHHGAAGHDWAAPRRAVERQILDDNQ